MSQGSMHRLRSHPYRSNNHILQVSTEGRCAARLISGRDIVERSRDGGQESGDEVRWLDGWASAD
jgi:hypothetical protein